MISLLLLLALSEPAACDGGSFISGQKSARSEINSNMETDLKVVGDLLHQRNDIRARLVDLDSMPEGKRRLKSIFNENYDPRVLRGRDERIGLQIDGLKDELSFLEAKNRALDSELKEFALRCPIENSNAPNH
jgi:hypothetical protein